MAYDDPNDVCDSCIVFTGFEGTFEELQKAIHSIKCEDKEYCIGKIKLETREP